MIYDIYVYWDDITDTREICKENEIKKRWIKMK